MVKYIDVYNNGYDGTVPNGLQCLFNQVIFCFVTCVAGSTYMITADDMYEFFKAKHGNKSQPPSQTNQPQYKAKTTARTGPVRKLQADR